jgi:hypothetical protein
MRSGLLWPYDEVLVDESEKGVLLKAPWIEVSVERTPDNGEELTRLVQTLKTPQLDAAGAQLVTEYFAPLEEHYLCYTLPTPLPEGLDVHRSQGDLHALSLPTLAAMAVCASKALTEMQKAEVLKSWEPRPHEWSWDADAALGFASIGDAIHPVSLFSVARRYHLLSLMDKDPGTAVFSRLAELPEPLFQKAAAVLLRQNHYVTEKCEGALQPALETAGRAAEQVRSFMQQERGHDRLLGKAVESLGTDPALVPVADMTRILMALLEFAAARNFLAFAMAIDFFERRIYDKVEPLAQLLDARGFSEAANRISQHKNINDSGDHHSVGREMLDWMAPCDPLYAREALRIAEATSYAMSQVVRSAYELVGN